MSKYSIAVTGGIGSGKSEALNIIKDLGFTTFSCDEIAKEAYLDKNVKKELLSEFESAFDESGNVSKKALADIVFNDKVKLKKLNSITHPFIVKTLFERIESESGVVVSEVPVLFESGLKNNFDAVLVIKRDLPARIRAIESRSGLTEEEALNRIKNQFDYDGGLDLLINAAIRERENGKKAPVYTVIENSSTKEALKEKIAVFMKEVSLIG